jgi:hypothetical protein
MKKLFVKCHDMSDGERQVELFNFRYAYKAILVLTLGWLCFQAYEFHTVFETSNYFGRMFMNELPTSLVFHSIIVVSFCITCYLFLNDNWWLRLILTFCVSWLNLAQWSYGVMAGVGFLFIYAHLFSVFIPQVLSAKKEENQHLLRSIRWFYVGVFFTYSFAGFWKLGGLLYKLMFCVDCIHWLHPKAAWITAAVSFRDYDLAYPSLIFRLLDFPIIWQLGFILVMLTQFFSIAVAFVPKIRVWFLIVLVLMHVINSVFFCTTFILQPIVVFCLLFPFHRLFEKRFALYCTKHSGEN